MPGAAGRRSAGSGAVGVGADRATRGCKVAGAAVDAVYRSGFGYKKAGVTFYDLSPEESEQPDLFVGREDPREKALMNAIDAVNSRHGKGAVQLASAGLKQGWRMKRQQRSPSYTTVWEDLPVVETEDLPPLVAQHDWPLPS